MAADLHDAPVHHRKRWTDQDDADLLRHVCEDSITLAEIGVRLKRTTVAIVRRLSSAAFLNAHRDVRICRIEASPAAHTTTIVDIETVLREKYGVYTGHTLSAESYTQVPSTGVAYELPTPEQTVVDDAATRFDKNARRTRQQVRPSEDEWRKWREMSARLKNA